VCLPLVLARLDPVLHSLASFSFILPYNLMNQSSVRALICNRKTIYHVRAIQERYCTCLSLDRLRFENNGSTAILNKQTVYGLWRHKLWVNSAFPAYPNLATHICVCIHSRVGSASLSSRRISEKLSKHDGTQILYPLIGKPPGHPNLARTPRLRVIRLYDLHFKE
jgi:hypothetical protein